jgi:putative ABC transport system permease protein
MWRITWRDLVFRRRRFLLASTVTAIAFAVSLLLSGVIVAVQQQNRNVVSRFQADAWWVPPGAGGPFTDGPVVAESRVDEVAALPGVSRAQGVLLLRTTLTEVAATGGPGEVVDVNMVGVPIGGIGTPKVDKGRVVKGFREVVVDDALGHDVGDTVLLGGKQFRVVGVANGISYLFGVPAMFLSLSDAQDVGAHGEPALSAIVTQGVPRPGKEPVGLVRYTDRDVLADLNRVVGQGFSAVQTMRVIMLVAALGIVALIIYLSSLERMRDIAVLKATGASSRFVAGGLVVQALFVTLAATAAAIALAPFLKPLFPLRLELTARVHAELVLFAVLVGLVASVAGIRRLLSVEPATAFE